MRFANSVVDGTIKMGRKTAEYERSFERLSRELAASESRFRNITLASADAIIVVSEIGGLLFTNPAAERLFGRNTDSLVSLNFGCPALTDVLQEMHIVCADGSLAAVEVRTTETIWDDQPAIIVTLRNISERKRIESDLRVKTSAMSAASDQIFILDLDFRVVYANPAFERENGYSIQDMEGKPPLFLTANGANDNACAAIWASVSAGRTWRGEIVNLCSDGVYSHKEMTVTPVVGENGGLEHYLAIQRDIGEKKLYERKLDHLAHHDSLTGLPNRALFHDRLSNTLARARRSKQGLAVIFLDLDGFKHINDSLGHKVGDRILHSVAKRLTKNLREADTVARMSGDEFTIIVQDIENSDGAVAAAQRIRESFVQPFRVLGHELYVTASLGIALYPEDGKDAQSLLKAADTAMYRAKQAGCNNYQLYTSEMHKAALERVELGNGLRKAITNQEFVVHYQPRFDLRSNCSTGVEALVRWIHPTEGMISPARFIPLAEESGLIESIGEWVLRTACKQAAKWVKNGLLNADIAVNVSARQFIRTDLVRVIERALSDTGLDPRRLSLELTESALMMEPENAIRTLHRLKGMGIGIAIDDFGTGYSSLAYLKQYPIDALKIDRSFVKEITINPDDAAIAGAIISMAHNLCLKVVAEGVETSEQLELLRIMQCDEMQGFLISKPLPADEYENLIKNVPKHAEQQTIHHYG